MTAWARPASLSAGLVGVVLLVLPVLSGCLLLTQGNDRHGLQDLDEGRFLAGAWLGSWPSDDNPVIHDFQHETGVRLDLVDVYLDWDTPVQNVTHTLHHIARHGAIPVLTWEAQTITTQDILDGSRRLPLRDGRTLALDEYLAEFAKGVCAVADSTGQPVLLRVLHEMNGNWFAWGISYEDAKGNRPNTADSYHQAWAKIHDAFTSRCGDGVRFVWAINHFSVGSGADFTNAYPGDDLVDFVAIDGYNWGTNAPWGWQSFDTIFRDGYCALAGLTNKPVLVAEIASTEKGGDKAAWIHDVFTRVPSYDRIRGLVWFNDDKYEIQVHGPMDWPLDSSPGALAAYQQGQRSALKSSSAT